MNDNNSLTKQINLNVKIPYVMKNKVLFAPGVWNNINYPKDAVIRAYKNTDWNSDLVKALFYDHKDQDSSNWLGRVENVRLNESTGEIIGDVYIYDVNVATKLSLGKPDFGISAKALGQRKGNSFVDFVFDNFSLVINPGVQLSYVAFSNKEEGDNVDKVEVETLRQWDTKYINSLPDSAFAVVEKDYIEGKTTDKRARHLPYKDAEGNIDLPHLRNALARLNQIKPIGESETAEQLIARAKKVLDPLREKYFGDKEVKNMVEEKKDVEVKKNENEEVKPEEKIGEKKVESEATKEAEVKPEEKEVKEEVKEAENKNVEDKTEIKEVEDLKKEIDNLKKSIEEIKKILSTTKNENKNVETKINKLEEAKNKLEENTKEVKQEVKQSNDLDISYNSNLHKSDKAMLEFLKENYI